MIPATAQRILDFWFEETPPALWFAKDAAFDERLRELFQAQCEAALAGGFADWEGSAHTALALILLLDQFPRNIWRDLPRAFAGDERAERLARKGADAGWLESLGEKQRPFLLMPLMHSEELASQRLSERLFARYGNADNVDFARKHREIIQRFGRFPHRNEILGRPSSAEERAFLATPGSSF